MSVKIFFCYAHEDEQLLNRLKAHLKPLQRQGLIEVWYDREINAGTEWESEIKRHLKEAQITLLLVSPDFMNSDYCYGVEMKGALERHDRGEAHVIPVVLRPVYWQGVLGGLQALPTDGRPVVDRYWHSTDEAFLEVVEGIRKVAEQLTAKTPATSPEAAAQDVEKGNGAPSIHPPAPTAQTPEERFRSVRSFATTLEQTIPPMSDPDDSQKSEMVVPVQDRINASAPTKSVSEWPSQAQEEIKPESDQMPQSEQVQQFSDEARQDKGTGPVSDLARQPEESESGSDGFQRASPLFPSSPNQSSSIPPLPQPRHGGISRRAVMLGLAGLATIGVAGGGLAWLVSLPRTLHQTIGHPTQNGSTASSNTPSPLRTPGAYTCVPGNITVAGSTALAPLVTTVAKDYEAKCSLASITVNLGGSGLGLASVENGSIQIGNSDIFKKAGQEDLVDHQVAVVVFTLVINSRVTGVTNLTTPQIKGIYSGAITNWNQVGGPDLPIVVISRPTTSGTRATFQTYILGGPETIQGPASLVTDSTGTVATEVNQTDGAIGYVITSAARQLNLTMVNIDGNSPTDPLVESNTYKFWNIEHMYTKGPATGLAQELIDYMLSPQGKQEATNLGFIAITDMQQAALQAHQPA